MTNPPYPPLRKGSLTSTRIYKPMPIYLDNAATSFPKPETVYRAVEHAMRMIGAGPGRGGYRAAMEATRLVFEARETIAAFFGIADSSRIVFTHSATEALNLAVQGLLEPGDHVVTTTMEHNALARPLFLMEKRGVTVTRVECDRAGILSPAALAGAIRPETRLIALSHCSNVTGTIQPVGEIGRLARRHGVPLLADAAQSAGELAIDVAELGIDLLAAPGHKGLLGPQGTGFLYVAPGLDLRPLLVGGTGGYSTGAAQPEAMPERLESGTLNTPGIIGLKAGVEFIRDTGISVVRGVLESRVKQLVDGLMSMPEVIVHGPERLEDRGGLVSFSVEGKDPSEIGFRLDQEHEISVRVGLHCAPDAHRTIGTFPAGTVRVSPGFFTSEADVDTFLAALRSITG